MSKEVSASGFVAGTLVHTDKGLVPIDKLKVGDMVLSRPENDPNAPNEYKRVVKTFKSAEKKKITYVIYEFLGDLGARALFCTEDHPFWTVTYDDYDDIGSHNNLGWQPVSNLGQSESHLLINYKHQNAFVTSFQCYENVIYEEDNSKITFLYDENDDYFAMYDFRSGQPVCIGGLTYKGLHPSEAKSPFDIEMLPEMLELVERRKSEIYYDHVYNIEVEDYHTYFMGFDGIWIHNSNAGVNLGVFPSSPKVTQP